MAYNTLIYDIMEIMQGEITIMIGLDYYDSQSAGYLAFQIIRWSKGSIISSGWSIVDSLLIMFRDW